MERRIPLVLTDSVGLILLFVLTLAPFASVAATIPPVATHGYSIFDETMVDMTWPQVEKAAQEGAAILFGDPASFDPEASRQRTEGLARSLASLIENFMKGKGEYKASEIK